MAHRNRRRLLALAEAALEPALTLLLGLRWRRRRRQRCLVAAIHHYRPASARTVGGRRWGVRIISIRLVPVVTIPVRDVVGGAIAVVSIAAGRVALVAVSVSVRTITVVAVHTSIAILLGVALLFHDRRLIAAIVCIHRHMRLVRVLRTVDRGILAARVGAVCPRAGAVGASGVDGIVALMVIVRRLVIVARILPLLRGVTLLLGCGVQHRIGVQALAVALPTAIGIGGFWSLLAIVATVQSVATAVGAVESCQSVSALPTSRLQRSILTTEKTTASTGELIALVVVIGGFWASGQRCLIRSKPARRSCIPCCVVYDDRLL